MARAWEIQPQNQPHKHPTPFNKVHRFDIKTPPAISYSHRQLVFAHQRGPTVFIKYIFCDPGDILSGLKLNLEFRFYKEN